LERTIVLPVNIEKSTTITGFYGRLEEASVLQSLGVISEQL